MKNIDIKKIKETLSNLSRKQKNILSLIVLVLMVGIITLVVVSKKDTTIKQDFHIDDIASISKITIKDKDNHYLVLEKQSDSSWTVNKNYQANMLMVNTVLETFKDMRIREPLPKAARNNIVMDLATNSRKVEVYKDDYLINWKFIKLFKRVRLYRTYYVGWETQDEMGTYMLRKGDKEPYIIYIPNFKGYLSTRFSAVEDLWRAHTVFKYKEDDIAKIKVELPSDQKESFELIKNGKGYDFRLLQTGEILKQFDTTKVVAFLSSFFEMNYERVAKNISKIEQDTIFTRPPSFVFTVTNKKGKTNVLRTFVKLNDPNSIAKSDTDFYQIFDINRCYALSSHCKDTLVMQFFVLDNAMRPASYFYLRKQK